MAGRQMKPAAKLFIILIAFGALFGIYSIAKNNGWIPTGASKSKEQKTASSEKTNKGGFLGIGGKSKKPIVVCVNTWPGFAGGQWFNGGFEASEESRFYTEYGILVEFKVNDDLDAARAGWKSGEYDLMWTTVDSFSPETPGLEAEFHPNVFLQIDWSRGGDAVVVRPGISSVQDLRGKKIALAYSTPSHTLLLWLLESSDMTQNDVVIVQKKSALDAAADFKAGQVDAAVVWSPDDQDCVSAVPGSKVLKSTKEASHIIADAFFVKEEFMKSRREELLALAKGWLIGNATLNTNPEAKAEAVKILTTGYPGFDESFWQAVIDNARLATYGDNVNFFGLNRNYTGVTGESLYTKMATMYRNVGFVKDDIPAWRIISDPSIIQSINLTGSEHLAEGAAKFETPTETETKAPAVAVKKATVEFATNSAWLSPEAKYVIDVAFGDVAKGFARNRVRVEGNTDERGSRWTNQKLSEARAESVANYLVERYSFDRNRFIVKGNGPDNPIDLGHNESAWRKNRRTDFELLSE